MSLHPELRCNNNPGRVTKQIKEKSKEYNWKDINFPLTLKGIKTFEKNNRDVGLVVYTTVGDSGQDLKKISPLWSTKKEKDLPDEKLAKIFFILGHSVIVKDEGAFLSHGESHHHTKICRRCGFHARKNESNSAEIVLKNHLRYCENHDYCKETFPKVGKNIMKFKRWDGAIEVPIDIAFDFECLLKKCDKGNMKKVEKLKKHHPISWGIYVRRFDEKNEYFHYVGRDASQKFVEKIEEITKNWYEEFKDPRPMKNSEEADEAFLIARECWICGEEFGDGNRKPVRDYCHFTGNFRGISHSECNMKLKRPKFIPVYSHNLSGYDEKLFFRDLVNRGFNTIIPKNEENFISFSKFLKVDKIKSKEIFKEIRFLDSLRFMNTSLAKLAENLGEEDLIHLKREFPEKEKLELIRHKGIYPYDYMDCEERLDETKLPPKKKFYDSMKEKETSDEEYERAKKVWKVFKCKTIRDYHNIYQKVDVLLLADVMEAFRKMSMKNYGLEPLHFFTTPSLGWQALLKITKVEFELFSEEQSEMYRMIEEGIRGGVTNAVTRYAKANNPYMGEKYDPKIPTSYIKYLDKNGLYSGIMGYFPMPLLNFEWIKKDEDWEEICEKEGMGCILEVNLEYPKELHDLHNEFPLAVERGEKLTPNFADKKRYVVHYKN